MALLGLASILVAFLAAASADDYDRRGIIDH